MAFPVALAAILWAFGAAARSPDALTIAGGVVCTAPWNLREGIVAANRGDMAWLNQIGCIRLKANIRTILIDPAAPLGRPWQVRLIAPDGTAGTFWGYAPSFKSAGGKPFWPQK